MMLFTARCLLQAHMILNVFRGFLISFSGLRNGYVLVWVQLLIMLMILVTQRLELTGYVVIKNTNS